MNCRVENCRLMFRFGRAAIALIMCLQLLNAAVQAQPEAWADARLKVRDGLELWLDAASLNAARVVAGQQPLTSGAAVDVWQDAAGHQRHLMQPIAASQPQLMNIGDAWLVRFDGADDHLRCLSTAAEVNTATIFIVAAPQANPGDFRGLLATNAVQSRDYESGFTIDLGPGPAVKFDFLNLEGCGFGGARNLVVDGHPLGTLHTLETVLDAAQHEVRLLVDGQPQGTRPLAPATCSLEQLTVGARFYTNGPGEQIVRGPVNADIAEILIYNRTLTSVESESVRSYLHHKYKQLAEELPKHAPRSVQVGIPLVQAEHAPAIQLLVPGFSVREIPVELTNVNNVRFREDGKLVTLGYNGDIHLLSDTDGDGLEDHADLFWKNQGSLRGPLGIVLTPPNYPQGWGLFTPSKGKVSLIVDTNADDRADEEIVVATGWKEITQNVDAVGITMDSKGNIYFGLGTANYANAYLVNDAGQADYDLQSDRGTVQKVSADFSHRETVCTGIRFPIAFGFNREGDLFCTEQEGATWLANGNPLDELLHIQPARHYGFPPRHPQHNPGVLDEPSTFDFGPQHQSTCGMVFDESVNGGPLFGPTWWAGNALICGESRGKIWRTQLVKSTSGYVATSQLIACLQMLTVDCCVAPNGDLVVACHSGPPDWGTGPTGIGKLFRVSMSKPQAPRPVATWAESLQEVRITFDQPLDPVMLRNLSTQARIEYGDHVRAGDRFESLVPPYAVVRRQQLVPRFELPVLSVAVTNDLRTLILNTAPMAAFTHYAVTLPGIEGAVVASGGLPQHPQLDVDFALHGVRAEWKPTIGDLSTTWSGWLPHLDLSVSKALLTASAPHQQLWELLQQPGTLTLTTQVDVQDILRPAVQPGETLDYEWPAEQATLAVQASQEFQLIAAGGDPALGVASGKTFVSRVQGGANAVDPLPVSVTLVTGPDLELDLTCSVSTNEDQRSRPLPLHRFILPWASKSDAAGATLAASAPIPELAGGSWGAGRRVFRSEAAGCFKCHALHGDNSPIGPDLHKLVQRDYASVLRDILQPSFAINPDHIGHVVALKDGRVLTGVLRTEHGELLLGDEKGNSTTLQQADIEELLPAKESIMPKGLLEKLTAEQVRDLLTYLLTSPPQMPLEAPLPAPPLRTRAEVAAALSGAPAQVTPLRPLNIVLVAGQKDHGPGEHDYPAWQRVWLELLTADSTLNVSTAWEFPSDEQLATADVLIFFQKGSFAEARPHKLDAYLQRGGGAVYIHWAVNGNDQVQDFSQRIGMASWGGKIKFRHGPLDLEIHNTDHPIVRNFDQLQLYDESYWLLTGKPADITLLATSREDDQPTPQMWVRDHHPGRVFVSIPGHYSWTFDDPLFRILLLRGIAWTAQEPVDRFNELVPLGARMSR